MKAIPGDTRKNAISLLQSGKSIRQVADSIGISKSAVEKIGKTCCQPITKGKPGKPVLLSDANKRFCVRQMTKSRGDNAVKVRKLLDTEVGVSVSVDTVRRALHGCGLGAIEKPKKPLLTRKNVKCCIPTTVHWLQ